MSRQIFVLSFFLFSLLIPWNNSQAEAQNIQEIQINKSLVMEVNSSINPATLSYIQTGFKKAKGEEYQMVVIKMNTPGGLVTTTKDILALIGNADVPVTIWITPEGASATSAGAIIASGAHFLFMSEGTNIGAATPIQMGSDMPKDLRSKAINDLVALTSSLADSRGRNGKLFGEMISEASSFTAQQAAEKNITNGVANDLSQVFSQIHGQTVAIKGTKAKFMAPQVPMLTQLEMDLGQSILDILANPSMAYILFLIGAALIYFEIQAPGGFVAGGLGVLAIILAGIGFQVLPLNFGALGLIVLSFVLFILEAFITSYGLLTVAGLASLIIGSLFLYRSENSYLDVQTSLIFSAVAAVAAFLGLIVFFIARDTKRAKKANKFFSTQGKVGLVHQIYERTSLNEKQETLYHLQVKIGPEFWNALAKEPLSPGEEVVVVNQLEDTLELLVERRTTVPGR